ncbi:mannitol dehydrogenase family protein [Streptomyces sp. V4I23]|uniref:mannitol dehydrogenase family protein n=1 Tax=Streptomyces sp. V4I23 TaxID=3042282 RepID=UPI0027D85B9A|nr:mannitol dehydrogenase family protein [Streptomyces sp. V4I23]
MLHLGLGNFFRAHQAWYTDRASDAGQWGIAAFTGRRPGLADVLSAQGGLYTLLTRGSEGDRFDILAGLSATHAGNDHRAWTGHWRLPGLAVVTLTVTEAGYSRRPGGGLDTGADSVATDIAALRADPTAPAVTAAGKLLAGLAARDRGGFGRVAVVSCDNLPDNGRALENTVRELARHTGRPELTAAIDRCATFATTVVDRITPRTTDEDLAAVAAATGLADAAPVVTEPFSEWVISGEFPAGRPRWEEAGARFVADVTPYEQRKLWLLNGAHSLLAYAGGIRGRTTVADAVADPVCRDWLAEWWAEASRHLTLPQKESAAYRTALLERFANPRIRHALAQIAADGSQKLPVRILPVLRRERAAGRVPQGAVRVLAAWVCHLRGLGVPVTDTEAARIVPLAQGPLPAAVRGILTFLGPELAADLTLVDAVRGQAEALCAP